MSMLRPEKRARDYHSLILLALKAEKRIEVTMRLPCPPLIGSFSGLYRDMMLNELLSTQVNSFKAW